MKRIASPMIGGLLSLTVLTLIIIPVAYVTCRAGGLPPQRPAESA